MPVPIPSRPFWEVVLPAIVFAMLADSVMPWPALNRAVFPDNRLPSESKRVIPFWPLSPCFPQASCRLCH